MENFSKESISQRADSGGDGKHPTVWCWLLRLPVQIGLVLVLGLGIYLHTLHAPFTLDDLLCIVSNPAIRGFDYLFDLRRVNDLNIWIDIKNNMSTRTVVYWTFALNYQFGGYNVLGYHLVNIALHLLNAVLVYLLARVTLIQTQSAWVLSRGTGLIPLLVAMLFVAHPLQTQAVTYVNQRFTLLLAFFYFAALLLYVAARTTLRPAIKWVNYCFALLATVLAMKTQESAFTLPVMLLLYDLLFLDGSLRQRLVRLIPFLLTMSIIPVSVLRLSDAAGARPFAAGAEQAINLVNFSGISQWDYLRTQFGVIVSYLRLFLFPVGQNVIPHYPKAGSFFEPYTLVSFLLLLLLLGGALFVALRSFRTRAYSASLLIAFGILWFFVTIAMSSSIIPLDAMMLEYRVYLPSFGVFFAFAVAGVTAINKIRLPLSVAIAAATLLVTIFSVATFARNNVYNDEETLLTDVLSKNPEALSARLRMAQIFMRRGALDKAIGEFNKILQVTPDDVTMINNLGNVLFRSGRRTESAVQFRRALMLDPGNSLAHANLGIVYQELGLLPEAEAELRKSLAIDPRFVDARQSLAVLYEEQGRTGEAIEQYRQLLQTYPDADYYEQKLRELSSQ